MQTELSKMIAMTARLNEGKLDMGGKPYVLHCMRVMNKVMTRTNGCPLHAIVAVGHDNIEDHFKDPLEGLIYVAKNITENPTVLNALDLVTHRKDVPYFDYIKRMKDDNSSSHMIAVQVKIADLEDNTDIMRLKGLREKDFDRLKKYHKSYCFLTGQTHHLLDL